MFYYIIMMRGDDTFHFLNISMMIIYARFVKLAGRLRAVGQWLTCVLR